MNIDNLDRMTALHYAAYSPSIGDPLYRKLSKKKQKDVKLRQVEMVRLLIGAGANPFKASVRGEYLVLEYLFEPGIFDVRLFLVEIV